jgi:hypothetical protein
VLHFHSTGPTYAMLIWNHPKFRLLDTGGLLPIASKATFARKNNKTHEHCHPSGSDDGCDRL